MKRIITSVVAALLLTSCVSDEKINQAVKDAVKKDPTLIADAIKAHPAEIMEALQDAAKNARAAMEKKRQQEQEKELHDAIEKPFVPQIRDDEAIRGTKGGVITLVEYSDFQCPYCTKGFTDVVKPLLDKYKGKVQFIYKHLPLSFHREARLAAQYYEALRIQDPKMAFAFHDRLFKQDAQNKLRQFRDKFLDKEAKKLGANMKKLAKDVNSEAVKARIREDETEARKFNIQGTPGFLINGVPVRGAYPLSHFEMILDLMKKKGKLQL
jgi:protein-disulfide isomerase